MDNDSTQPKGLAAADPLISPRDLGELCGVPIGTVYQWNCRGVGPRMIKVGKHVRYRMSDINVWLDQHAVGGDAA